MSLDARLQRLWYGPAWRSLPLWPLEALYRLATATRSMMFRTGLRRVHAVGVPVIVVGNLTVGGTGKTPIAAWLAGQLRLRGRAVGVVLRGYGGSHAGRPRIVTPADDPTVVGDEALLHARRSPHVVVIGADRVAAARHAVAQGAEVIVCDDGLQHLRLARDVEIAVLDAGRGLGNGHLLPAGPLREPRGRLEQVDAVVLTRRAAGPEGGRVPRLRQPMLVEARFATGDAVNLRSGERRPLSAFAGQRVDAVAGIGHPEAFFASLRSLGIAVEPHALPDHARLEAGRLPLAAQGIVLMTEKDAVKCGAEAQPGWWWVELDVEIDRDAAGALLTLILERTGLTGAGVRLG